MKMLLPNVSELVRPMAATTQTRLLEAFVKLRLHAGHDVGQASSPEAWDLRALDTRLVLPHRGLDCEKATRTIQAQSKDHDDVTW